LGRDHDEEAAMSRADDDVARTPNREDTSLTGKDDETAACPLIHQILRPSSWQAHVLTSLDEVCHDLTRVITEERRQPPLTTARNDEVRHAIDEAQRFATSRNWRLGHPIRWLGGGQIDSAYRHLPCAEVFVADLLPEEQILARAPGLLIKYKKCLEDKDDPRLTGLEDLSRLNRDGLVASARSTGHAVTDLTAERHDEVKSAGPSEIGKGGSHATSEEGWRVDSAVYSTALRNTYDILDQKYTALRHLRNGLLLGALILSIIVISVCAVSAIAPSSVPLCFRPPENASSPEPDWVCPSSVGDGGTEPGSSDLALIALFGLIGAALSSAISLSNLPKSRETHTIAYALALFKLPLGALTAVGGILLIHGRFVPGLSQLDTQPQILAYAFVFGFAQLVVTRLIDRQAGDIISQIPTKEASPGSTSFRA
jgi:hypothetical protein